MKKVFKIFMMLMFILAPVVVRAEDKKEPVNFYIFYGESCNFCQQLHEFTDELQENDEYNYMFNIVDLEVWKNQENNDLMVEVGEYFDYNVTGVPFYVIGDEYFTGYSAESSQEQIKEAIKAAYNDEDYEDIVAGINGGSITSEDKDASEDDEKKKNDLVGYIILGITAVIIIAIIFGRSNTQYYDEEEAEDDVLEKEETVKTEPKKTTKKTSNKSKSTTKKKDTKK